LAERGSYPLHWVDVFSTSPLAGNQLAVVHDADGLDDETMLAFARETKLSETTFVQTPEPEEVNADYRNRIFFPGGEMPFAGHPSLGTAVAVAMRRGAREASYVQQTIAGLQPIDVIVAGNGATATMLQEPAEFGDQPDPGDALGVLGLRAEDADPARPPQFISCGVRHLIAPVRDAGVLAQARPDGVALADLIGANGITLFYLAAVDAQARTARARGFFLDQNGNVMEDPATGSAAGPLMALTHELDGIDTLTVDQGVEMGRPSRIACSFRKDRPQVGGDVVLVAEGDVLL
jgi:trans-2,3-dihydro-3-hydroxyanthranilate isomerase